MKFFIQTFGCQMNHSDSERLTSVLDSLGYSPAKDTSGADLIIYNTCSIKQQAEDRVLGQMKNINRLRKKKPNLLVALTGCMTRLTSTQKSEKRDQLLKRLKEIDFVFQIQDMTKLSELLREIQPDIELSELGQADLDSYFKIQPKYQTKFQAYIPIMTGCDKFCTYCIVPYARGRETSRPIEQIYNEALKLTEEGYTEITLLGQNVNSYGLSWMDKKSDKFDYEDEVPFIQLIKKLDTIPGLKRLRFTSPHPQDMSNEVIDAIAESYENGGALMPYLHLPLQAGSDEVLRRMNRNYNTEKFKEIVDYARKRIPNVSITTDMIVGFCGETEEQFEETRKFFREMAFDLAYISQYSTRSGTAASKLMQDDVAKDEKHKRWHALNDILRETCGARNRSFLGKEVLVLVEGEVASKEGYLYGRSEHYKEVHFKASSELIGQYLPVTITEAMDWVLEGEV